MCTLLKDFSNLFMLCYLKNGGDWLMRILWDFDGTIMDTYPAYTDILYDILNGNFTKEEIYQQLKISQSHAMDYFQLTDEQRKEMIEKSRAITNYTPFPYVENVLQQAEVNVIMTHMNRASVERILQETDLAKYFTEIVAGDDGFARKPDPAAYVYLHERYELDYAIGDRELDLIPAKKAGFKTIMFQNDCDVADYTINDYHHFFDLIP